MSTTCNSPTDAISDWTLFVCADVLLRHLSSWLMDVCTVLSRSFCGFFGVTTISTFSSVNNMMLTSLSELWATVLNGWVLRWGSHHSALGHGDFEHKYFTRYLAMHKRRGEIFSYCFTSNLLLSPPMKEFWKWVRGKSRLAPFSRTRFIFLISFTFRPVQIFFQFRFIGILTAAHSNGQDIIFCSCRYVLFSFFFFFSSFIFLAHSKRSESRCLSYFHT